MWKRWICSVVILGILGTNQWSQEDEASGGRTARLQNSATPTVELRELSLVHYRPKFVSPRELSSVVGRMLGRSLHVVERGNVARPIDNLSELGGQIIIYDTKEYAARVLETLKALDQPNQEAARGADMTESSEIMVEYTARHVPVSFLNSALRSFGSLNYSPVGNRMIAARMPKSRKAEFVEFLERVDQPGPCVRLTCYLLIGSDSAAEGNGPQPPAEVLQSLKSILPDLEFRSIGFSMVQSTISEGRPIELGVSGADDMRYELKFNPLALDVKSGDMNVLNCELLRHKEGTGSARGQDSAQLMLRTDTVFRGNQFTVLGASGKDPVFVVIHSRMVP